MSKRNVLASLIVILLCCVCTPAQTAARPATPVIPTPAPANTDETTTGAISGSVVNESGQPFAGVQVAIRAMNGSVPARTSITDSDGNFRLNGLPPALYIISASTPAYVTEPRDPNLPPVHNRLGDSVKLQLIRGGVITGTVTNAAGEPMAAVAVRAWMVRDGQGRVAKMPYVFFQEQTTDDRGIYRIFGLLPGTYVVSAGGAGFSQRFQLSPYAFDVPTYAPSSTRDGAAEISVRGGEESSVDIRYRAETGHSISGAVKVTAGTGASITLSSATNGFTSFGSTSQNFGAKGFEFFGLADGDYVLVAREIVPGSAPLPSALLMSDPRRITVKGADITGIELVPKPLAALSGHVVLEPTKPAECEGKRRPLFSEMMVTITRPEKDMENDLLPYYPTSNSTSIDAKGNFVIRNLIPARYMPQAEFYARYWYLNSMTIAGPPKVDAAANWTTLKTGDHTDITISLAEGAASIRGRVTAANDAGLPSAFGVYLIPAEREKTADVLRYFVTSVGGDGTFAFNSLPPGRYLTLVQTLDAQTGTLAKLRLPESLEARAKLRRTAEAQKTNLELKPCQNLTDLQLAAKQ
jgi:hypothetical protein